MMKVQGETKLQSEVRQGESMVGEECMKETRLRCFAKSKL